MRQVKAALRATDKIPIQLIDITPGEALNVATHLDIYAYDAYFIQCALKHKSPLLTLDKDLCRAARRVGVAVIEVEP